MYNFINFWRRERNVGEIKRDKRGRNYVKSPFKVTSKKRCIPDRTSVDKIVRNQRLLKETNIPKNSMNRTVRVCSYLAGPLVYSIKPTMLCLFGQCHNLYHLMIIRFDLLSRILKEIDFQCKEIQLREIWRTRENNLFAPILINQDMDKQRGEDVFDKKRICINKL